MKTTQRHVRTVRIFGTFLFCQCDELGGKRQYRKEWIVSKRSGDARTMHEEVRVTQKRHSLAINT